jgi:hypothetical protein
MNKPAPTDRAIIFSTQTDKQQNQTKGKNMNNKFDELTKGLAQSVTRRAALKKFGIGIAGMSPACQPCWRKQNKNNKPK